MMANLLNQTATIERKHIALATAPTAFVYEHGDIDPSIAFQNAQGRPVEQWNTLSTVRCRIEDTQSKQILNGMETIVSELVCYMPDTDVDETDRIVVDATTYEPKKVVKARGMRGVDHVEIFLVQVDRT